MLSISQDDTFRDKFRTKDDPLTGAVSYVVRLPTTLWFIAQVADALTALANPGNWEQAGAVTIDDAVQASAFMLGGFEPMIGFIFPTVLAVMPVNMLACDGSTYLRVDYPALYAVLDSAFIVDSDHFTVPDLRDQVVIGAGSTYAVGAAIGEATHTLTIAEIPSHSHTYTSPLPVGTAVPPPLDASLPNPFPSNSGSTGGDGAHNNIQPSIALNYGIVAQ